MPSQGSKKIKLGLVCPYDILRAGGVQEHVLAQAEELRARGHEVKILTPRPRGKHGTPPEYVIFVGNSANVKVLTKTTMEIGINIDNSLLDEILAKEKFDLLHVHEPEVPILGAQIIARAKSPVIGTFHAVNPNTPMARTLEGLRMPFSRSLFNKLTAMTAVSDAAAGFVREHTGKKIEIIPNGIDLAKYHPTAKPKNKDKKTIFYVGRLEKRKGVRHLLKAYKIFSKSHPEAELIIAGEGHLRTQLETFAKDNHLRGVKFLGFVDEATKLKLFNEADLFCSPALFGESFGIVLLEAMAYGLPIVAANNIGYAGLMKNTGSISIVNPNDSEEFARRLELLLYDEKLRGVWKEWAGTYVKQFDYPKVVDKYEKLYKKVLSPK